jgi:hypothetical protein
MADGSSSVQSAAPLAEPRTDVFSSALASPSVGLEAKCGIVLIGHGNTASTLLEAARSIVPDSLGGVIAIDAGLGQRGSAQPSSRSTKVAASSWSRI